MTNYTIHNKTTIVLQSNGENNDSFHTVILVIVIILSTMVLCSIIISIYIYSKNTKIKNKIIGTRVDSTTFCKSTCKEQLSQSSEISNNLDKLTGSFSKSWPKDIIMNRNSLIEINGMRNAITIHDLELSEIYKKDHNKRLVFNPLNST